MDDGDGAPETALENAVHQLAIACVLAWARSRISSRYFGLGSHVARCIRSVGIAVFAGTHD
jgi:hypothetical protein